MTTVYEVSNTKIVKDLVFGWSLSVDGGFFVPLSEMDVDYLRALLKINWAPIVPYEFKEEIRKQIAKAKPVPALSPIVKKTAEDMTKSFDNTLYPTKEQSYELMILIIQTALDQHGVIELPYVKIQKNTSGSCSAFGKTHSDESLNTSLLDTDVSSIVKWICRCWW